MSPTLASSPPPSAEHARFINGLQKRLRKVGEETGRSTQSILLLYLQERLLFRISKSNYRDNFILKGGLLVYNEARFKGRPTRDIDLLAQQISPELDKIESLFREICLIPVQDGVNFDSNNVALENQDIHNDAVIRIKIKGYLGHMWAVVKIDLSFQGVVSPAPLDITFPVILDDQPHPLLKAYSIESTIAEKFQVMISLAEIDSRMKDFYDIYSFSDAGSFQGQELLTAVKETFKQRNTSLEESPVVFTPEFAHDSKRVMQWRSFLSIIGGESIEFHVVMRKITTFLRPIYDGLYRGVELHSKWNPSKSNWE